MFRSVLKLEGILILLESFSRTQLLGYNKFHDLIQCWNLILYEFLFTLSIFSDMTAPAWERDLSKRQVFNHSHLPDNRRLFCKNKRNPTRLRSSETIDFPVFWRYDSMLIWWRLTGFSTFLLWNTCCNPSVYINIVDMRMQSK